MINRENSGNVSNQISFLLMYDEQQILDQLKEGDEDIFLFLFHKYYKDLVLFAGTILSDRRDICEDIVQNVFLDLWSRRCSISIKTSLKSFLLQSVRNGCLDELRHAKIVRTHADYVAFLGNDMDSLTEQYILHSDLEFRLKEGLSAMPEEYRQAFELNRIHGLKYREIAATLQVSERTIEERIGKALKFLRHYLRDFFLWILFLLYL